MSTYELLNLYPHNIKTCKKVKEAFNNGQDIVSIIKATGTGKSYIGLNLALEHKDEKIIWLVPTNAIKEHIEQVINDNPNISMKKDFPNLEIRTYSSLVNLSDKEIESIDCDLLIVDELHHIGAPVWGEKVNYLIDSHEGMKAFGMSAYSVRDRGTSYERDMTNPDTEEIFSDTVVDRYDLYDAIIDGVLPFPVAKTVLTEDSSLLETLQDLLKLKKVTKKEVQQELEVMLDAMIKTIHKQNHVEQIIQESISENGKYIYFCPVQSYDGVNDIDTIREQVVGYIRKKYPDKRIVVYQTTSNMGSKGDKNRECFYHDVDLDGKDVSDTIKIMFAKNQYNEGVHAPNIDGVFLGRKTDSDIVALEQMGRALSVRENIKEKRLEYSFLDINRLKELARNKRIIFDENITKENLIELLISPMIIDLTGNIEFLEELETNLKDRARERRKENKTSRERLDFIEKYSPFVLETKDKNILIALLNLKNQILQSTWDYYYELAVSYYNHHGHSEMPKNFKTKNGYDYDESGIALGEWCSRQRQNKKLSEERRKKLEKINFRFENNFKDIQWEKKYQLALVYYNHYGHSEIPGSFKTKNGIDYDEDGLSLSIWCKVQRKVYQNGTLKPERYKKLEQINFRFESNLLDIQWEKMYQLALVYYNHYGHSEIPGSFKTKNGIDYAENGIALGEWCNRQRQNKKTLSKEKCKKLEQINYRFESNLLDIQWEKMYQLALVYYNHYGHSEIPGSFKTKNGIDYDEDGITLGIWCTNQRQNPKRLNEERQKKLKKIDFRFESNLLDIQWEKMYQLALVYYNRYGHSEIPQKFKTKNGIDYDKNGVSLGQWCNRQRQNKKTLSKEKCKKLEQINFRFENNVWDIQWEKMYQLTLAYYNHYGHSEIPQKFKTKNGIDYDSNGTFLGAWCDKQRINQKQMPKEKCKKLEQINFRFENNVWDIQWEKIYQLALAYYNHYGHSEIPQKFKTKNGVDFDETGEALGKWCSRQRENKNALSGEKIKKLEQIEFRFTTKKENEEKKSNLCSKYGINYEKYKILQNISYQELYAKIMFLLENNLPLEMDGKLHEIFTMSNENMIEKYKISKEELITNYYVERKGKNI